MQLTAICRVRSWGSRNLTQKVFRVMKLTAILLLSAGLAASAKGTSQTVTLDVKNVPIQKVFKEVIRQTGVSIVYSEALLKDVPPVTINVKKVPLKDVLDICFNNQDIEYVIKDNTVEVRVKNIGTNSLSGLFNLPLAPIDVHGRVVNEKGEPVVGATVQVRGEKDKGTTTDDYGYFILKGVDENATVVISAVNIETFEVKVNGKTDLVTLKAKTKIISSDEVKVNTGYQILKPNEVTGSVEIISRKQLDQRIETNLFNKLEGITNGLVFNKDPNTGLNKLRIRGESTIFGYQDPLLVIDNFPYPIQNINDINPNDVESVTILKDAAAASIYGARAGNGVIVITTKSGKVNQPLRLSITSNITITGKPELFYTPRLSPSQIIDEEISQFAMGHYNGLLSDINKGAVPPVVEILNNRSLGLISAADSAAQIDALRKNDWRNEALKDLYRKTVSQQYQMNLSGGSSKVNYYFSAGYDQSLSGLIGNQNNRITLSNRTVYRPFKKFEFNISLNYNEQKSVSNGISETQISNLYPYMKFADDNGNPLPIPQHRITWEDTIVNHGFVDMKYYPLNERNYASTISKQFNTRFLTQLQYTILRGLNISGSYQYYRSGNRLKNVLSEQNYFIRNNFNRFAIVSSQGDYTGTNYPFGGQLNLVSSDQLGHSGRFQIDYSQKWINHSVLAIAGYEVQETKTEGSSSKFYGYDDFNGSYVIPDYTTFYPTYVGETQVGTAQIGPVANNVSPYRLDRFRSYYANATYSYKNRYNFYANARLDQANIFGVQTNRKGTPLWSIGGRWEINKEKFYAGKVSDLVPELSLRITYGYQGNISPTAVAATTIRYDGNANYTGLPFAVIQNYPNPELRWEKIGQMNVGLKFVGKNNVVSGSIEYFRKNGKDMLGNSPVDPTTGISTMLGNFSDISSKGLDILLTTKNIDREFKWITTFIFNYAAEKVTRYDIEFGPSSTTTSYFVPTPIVGYPLYSVFSYHWGGLDPTNGNPRIVLHDTLNQSYTFATQSQIKMGDLKFNGRYNPPFAGSLTNSFSWKSIGLTFNITYKMGHYFRRSSINYADFLNDWRYGHSDYALRWQRPGDEQNTNVPSSIYPQTNGIRDQYYLQSDILVEKADHIRLQFVDLNYSFNNRLLKKLKMQNLTFHFYASNLGILWRANDKKIDPDYPYLDYPPSRSFSLGINATF